MGEFMVCGLFALLVFLGGCMCGSSLTAGRLKGGVKSKEWLAMTEVDRYMEIYRAHVRSQNL